MKKWLALISIALIAVVMMSFTGSFKKLWGKYEDSLDKGLPKTSIDILTDIQTKAKGKREIGHYFKASYLKSMLNMNLGYSDNKQNILDLETWLASVTTPDEKAILSALLFSSYTNYFNRNQYTFNDRTDIEGAEAASDDIDQWSVNQYQKRINDLYLGIWKDSDFLMNKSAKDYTPFVVITDLGKYFNNNLYHVLYWYTLRALGNYPYGPGWNENLAKDLRLKAIEDFSKNSDAVFLLELDSILNERSQVEHSKLDLLDQLIAKNADKEIVVEAIIAKNNVFFNIRYEEDKVNYPAYIAEMESYIKKYPKSKRIGVLKSIIEQIKAPAAFLTFSDYIHTGSYIFKEFKYKNINSASVDLLKWTGDSKSSISQITKDLHNADSPKDFVAKNTAVVDHVELKDIYTSNHQFATDQKLKLSVPTEGIYIVSLNTDKSEETSYQVLKALNTVLIEKSLKGKYYDFAAVDLLSGQPVSGAEIKISPYDDHNEVLKGREFNLVTDKDGRSSWTMPEDITSNEYWKIQASSNGNEISTNSRIYATGTNEKPYSSRITYKLITDRRLYRPGQTVYVKGYIYQQDSITGNFKVVPNYKGKLALRDNSGSSLAELNFDTNEFGSFTTDIQLPKLMLNGDVSMSVLNESGSSHSILVEEYKRPTLTFSFLPIEGAYKQGDKITLRGKVESFSQSLLTDAKLSAQVSMFQSFGESGKLAPYIWVKPRPSKTSVDDTITLSADGLFEMEIDTDASYSGSYLVKAKLVTADGETHEEETRFYVGTSAYSLSTKVPNVVDSNEPLELNFIAKNNDNNRVEGEGTYKIFKNRYDYESTEPLLVGTLNTNDKAILNLSKLPIGSYVLALYTPNNNEVSSANYFQVFSKNETTVPVESGDWLYVEKNTFSKDEPAVIYFGAAEKDVNLYVDIYSMNGKVSSNNLSLNASYTKIELPYSEEYKTGVTVLLSYFKNYQLYSKRVNLFVDAKEENLSLNWLSFRDHINAGAKEEWILQVLDANNKPTTEVELLALMYDASLDALTPSYMRNQPAFNLRGKSYPQVNIQSAFFSGYSRLDASFVKAQYKPIPNYEFDHFFFVENGFYRGGANFRIRGISSRANNDLSDQVIVAFGTAAPRAMMKSQEMDYVEEEVARVAEDIEEEQAKPAIRSNFDETAFFKPFLSTDNKGEVKISFISPEQLTKWNVQVYAHTKDMLLGYSDKITFTERKFAIQMNVPRFIRVGDQVNIKAILKNQYAKDLKTSVEYIFFDPSNDKQIAKHTQSVLAKSNSEMTISFTAPELKDRTEVGVRIIAKSGQYSDGEQYVLPILPNVEPFISGKSIIEIHPGVKKVDIKDLFGENANAAQQKEVLVEFTSNPLWFALDPIMRTWMVTSNSSLSISNKLAVSIVANELWSSNSVFINSISKKNAFKSFDNNEEFRAILAQETPWAAIPVNQDKMISRFHEEVVRNTSPIQIGIYLNRLEALQASNGGFAWYDNMEPNIYISLPVVKNLFNLIRAGKLERESAISVRKMFHSGITYLHQNLLSKAEMKDRVMPSVAQMKVLSMLLTLDDLSPEEIKSKDEIMDLLPAVLRDGSLLERAAALEFAVLAGEKKIANQFALSLNEHLIEGKEEGVYFGGNRFTRLSNSMQMETHIAAMQALELWQSNQERLDNMKFWLAAKLNAEKTSNEFFISKAILAIGMDGKDEKATNNSLRISLGNEELILDAKNPFVKKTVKLNKEVPSLTLQKEGNQVVWGRVIGKYFAEITEVKSSQSVIKVNTKYYIEQVVNNKKELKLITPETILNIGDVVVSRVSFDLEEDIDFVQITDSRAGNLEPVQQNSGYKWESLLRGRQFIPSYVSVRDASTQYFFYALQKGSYILENRSYVVRSGKYQTGTVTIQSAYAPELSGYSGSQVIQSK